MVGSSDGILKVFRNYEEPEKVELVTAFRALNELVPSNKTAGLVFDWQQGQGKALVAGDVKVIKVWNAATEVCTMVRTIILTHFVGMSLSVDFCSCFSNMLSMSDNLPTCTDFRD